MKNILIAVCGLSPQVITEALYALWHEGREIHAVHVISTRAGKERILASLLAPEDGKFQALLADCGIDPASIDFGSHNLHVLRDTNGRELGDIVTPDDNEILVRTCLDFAFRFTTGPETAVFFLVAGGRKTMTSCLTLAAQLYGRSQDRILHVLVSAPPVGDGPTPRCTWAAVLERNTLCRHSSDHHSLCLGSRPIAPRPA